MARCPFDKISNLEPVFRKLRKLDKIEETKPGIFYLKKLGFLHFHTKDNKIWADVRGTEGFFPVDVPDIVTKKFCDDFYKILFDQYEELLGLK